ncbi:phage integrase Arm DNA-binding domain-containing protein [Kluyvera ascorbata]|uniref:phage integrase Arm DNA-binding domain-containing protein n=1 Tax=Kluyvera ascorbata TaxID=51288 RepID=UPI002DB8351A|nr:phage integrase Arm DNA-binding domain-containing protein [Kluyvera ascorbata]MEB6387760.1 phage integrase Arm DNA-binding domain-containing protein [Kluyvera ascorbata]
MAARPRKHNVNIPNLYCKLDKRTSKVYWQYRHPATGVFIGFGTDEGAAKAAATEMNRIVAEQEMRQSYALVDMAIKVATKKESGIRVSQRIKKYVEIQEERMKEGEIKKPTVDSRRLCSKILSERVPNLRLRDVDTKLIATIIDEYKVAGKQRMGQLVRSVLNDVFKEAQHAGEVPAGYNPALAVKNPIAKVKRSRLTIEQWKEIFATAATLPPCAQNSMLLALVTGQRLGDIVSMKFSDVWDGYLHVSQNKTGVKIAIPLALKCDAIGMTLSDVISRCRDHVVSQFLVHHVNHHGHAIPGSSVPEKTISKYFAKARDTSTINWGKDIHSLPPFHEQRSLSSRTYKAQGVDVKTLLGHTTDAMSDRYIDDRGLGWKKLVL